MYILTYIQRLFSFLSAEHAILETIFLLSDAPSIDVPFLISLGDGPTMSSFSSRTKYAKCKRFYS